MFTKQKFFNYFNNLIFSCTILWAILIILSFNDLKPEIIIRFFLIFSLFLFLIFYFRKTFIFSILKLNNLNCFLKSTDKLPILDLFTKRKLLYLFLIQFLILLKNFPRLFKYLFINFLGFILIIAGILFNIFVFRLSSDLLILLLIVLWMILVYRYKFDGRFSIGLALGFLVLCPFLLSFNNKPMADKAAIWAYLFLVVGTIQLFIKELKD